MLNPELIRRARRVVPGLAVSLMLVGGVVAAPVVTADPGSAQASANADPNGNAFGINGLGAIGNASTNREHPGADKFHGEHHGDCDRSKGDNGNAGGGAGKPADGTNRGVHNGYDCTNEDNAPPPTIIPTDNPPPVIKVTVQSVAAPAPAAAAPAAPAATPFKAQSTKVCASRRAFTIRIRESRKNPVKSATVTMAGKTLSIVKNGRTTTKITLTGLPKGEVKVRIRAVLRNGKVKVGTRKYHPCTKKAAPTIPLL